MGTGRFGLKREMNTQRSSVPLDPSLVFVHYEEGLVSFYDVDTADPLHSFTDCSFREKLYPFFSPGLNNDGINSAPLTISPVSRTAF